MNLAFGVVIWLMFWELLKLACIVLYVLVKILFDILDFINVKLAQLFTTIFQFLRLKWKQHEDRRLRVFAITDPIPESSLYSMTFPASAKNF